MLGKPRHFGRIEMQLAATHGKKWKTPLERTLQQPEVNRLCEPIAHFHLHPWYHGQGRLTMRSVDQGRKGGITCRQGEPFLLATGLVRKQRQLALIFGSVTLMEGLIQTDWPQLQTSHCCHIWLKPIKLLTADKPSDKRSAAICPRVISRQPGCSLLQWLWQVLCVKAF